MTLAELILMCSLASSPHVQDTLYRVVLAHSGGQPLTIVDATTSRTYQVTDPARAALIAGRLEDSGHRLHIGVAGLSNHLRFRLQITPGDALKPCRNIGFASLELERVLTQRTKRDIDALHRALAHYFDPNNPEHLQAIAWGSRVLATPRVSVKQQVHAQGPNRLPTITYEGARATILTHTTPSAPAPKETEPKTWGTPKKRETKPSRQEASR